MLTHKGAHTIETTRLILRRAVREDAEPMFRNWASDPEVTDGLPEGKAVLFSSRSFSIFRVDENVLTQVFDSGKDFEELSNKYIPGYFNCSNDDNEYDSRSPKKGPEPERVTVGTVGNDLYAFIALERIGGIMAYKIDVEGETASFANYINT